MQIKFILEAAAFIQEQKNEKIELLVGQRRKNPTVGDGSRTSNHGAGLPCTFACTLPLWPLGYLPEIQIMFFESTIKMSDMHNLCT